MQRKSVVGTRSSLLWLLILVVVVILIGVIVGILVILPQMQASRTEQARLAEVERHYQAGVAFQSVEDWFSAESEYKQVIALDAGYDKVTERLAAVRAKVRAGASEATAAAIAQAERQQADSRATAQAVAVATQQALEVRYQRGLSYLNMSRWQEAKVELEAVFEKNPVYRDVQTKLHQAEIELAKMQAPTPSPTASRTPVLPTITVSPSSTPTKLHEGKTFSVDARLTWQDTGVEVGIGEVVQVKFLSGSWTTWKGHHPFVGPTGNEGFHDPKNSNHPLPSVYPGVLIGKVGNGTIRAIGAEATLQSTASGRLYLRMNDDQMSDNDGSLLVQIILDP